MAIDLRGVSLEADPWRYRVVEQCGETLEVVEVVCGRAFGPPPLPFSVVGLDGAPFDSPSGSLRSIAGEFWEGLDVVTFAYADDVQPRPNVIERWLDSRVEFGTVLAGSNNLLTVGFPTTT